MSLSLSNQWNNVVPLNDIVHLFLVVDEALEGFLGDFAERAIPTYSVNAKDGSVDRSNRSQLINAIDALGGEPRALHSRYTEPYDAYWTARSVRLSVLNILGEVCVSLIVEGQNEELAQGQFRILLNQISTLIDRDFPKTAKVEVHEERNNPIISRGSAASRDRSWIARTWRDHMAAFVITIAGGTASGLILFFFIGHS